MKIIISLSGVYDLPHVDFDGYPVNSKFEDHESDGEIDFRMAFKRNARNAKCKVLEAKVTSKTGQKPITYEVSGSRLEVRKFCIYVNEKRGLTGRELLKLYPELFGSATNEFVRHSIDVSHLDVANFGSEGNSIKRFSYLTRMEAGEFFKKYKGKVRVGLDAQKSNYRRHKIFWMLEGKADDVRSAVEYFEMKANSVSNKARVVNRHTSLYEY